MEVEGVFEEGEFFAFFQHHAEAEEVTVCALAVGGCAGVFDVGFDGFAEEFEFFLGLRG